MTIQEIQAAIDAKIDTRQIVNMIADYIQDNPSGGSFDIDALPNSDTLTGSEEVPIFQGSNKKATVNDLFPVQLQGDKDIDLNGKELTFQTSIGHVSISPEENYLLNVNDGTNDFLIVDPVAFRIYLNSNDPESNAALDLHGKTDDEVSFNLIAHYTNTDAVGIAGDGVANTLTYTAHNHIYPDLVAKDFADDAAAATGLVPVGGLYHTSGVLKIRLS